MAARYRNWTPEVVKQRIKVGLLVKRLEDHAHGLVEMSQSQVNAAKFLIERVVARAESPRQVDVTGHISLERLLVGAALSEDVSENAGPRPLSS